MYGHRSTKCFEMPVENYVWGFRFCRFHLSQARLILPDAAFPEGFIPDEDVIPIKATRDREPLSFNEYIETLHETLHDALVRDPYQSNRRIARWAMCDVRSVAKYRKKLEEEGLIPKLRIRGGRLAPGVELGIREALIAEPRTRNKHIAKTLQSTGKTVRRIRLELEAEGRIPIIRHRKGRDKTNG